MDLHAEESSKFTDLNLPVKPLLHFTQLLKHKNRVGSLLTSTLNMLSMFLMLANSVFAPMMQWWPAGGIRQSTAPKPDVCMRGDTATSSSRVPSGLAAPKKRRPEQPVE